MRSTHLVGFTWFIEPCYFLWDAKDLLKAPLTLESFLKVIPGT